MIQLGVTAKCKATGFQGVVMNRARYLHGSDRYEVQPPVDKDGKAPDSYTFDEVQLEVIDDKPKVRAEEAKALVELGQKVSDPISGIKGVAIAEAIFLNGCRRILVGTTRTNDRGHPVNTWIDEPQLEIQSKEVVAKSSSRTTGGSCLPSPSRDY